MQIYAQLVNCMTSLPDAVAVRQFKAAFDNFIYSACNLLNIINVYVLVGHLKENGDSY